MAKIAYEVHGTADHPDDAGLPLEAGSHTISQNFDDRGLALAGAERFMKANSPDGPQALVRLDRVWVLKHGRVESARIASWVGVAGRWVRVGPSAAA